MRMGIFLSLFLFPYVSVLHVYTHIPMLNTCFTVDFHLAIYLPLETNADQQNQVCWSSCVCQVEGRLRNIYSVFKKKSQLSSSVMTSSKELFFLFQLCIKFYPTGEPYLILNSTITCIEVCTDIKWLQFKSSISINTSSIICSPFHQVAAA